MYETNLNKTFFWTMKDVMDKGSTVEARGTEQKELTFYKRIIGDPTDLLISYPDRKFNKQYAITEWLWYLSQNRSTQNIGKMAKIWDIIKDDNGECESNYGSYMFPICLTYPSQWEWVVNELNNDTDSRRATIAINQPHHKNWDQNPKDIPCTQYIQFFIRDNILNMGVYMRSNDVIFGFCNDVFTFGLFHQLMYNDLKQTMPDLELGEYHHNAGSMHIYDRHYKMVNKIIKNRPSDYYKQELPKIKLHSHITSSYILKKELYLPSTPLSKDEIKEQTIKLSKMLLEEVSNG